jgi:hypothetical protein
MQRHPSEPLIVHPLQHAPEFVGRESEQDELRSALPDNLPYFRADLRLLQGRLPEVAAEGDPVRAAIASFLMGRSTHNLPADRLGLVVPRVQLLLFQGLLRQAWEQPLLDRLYKDIGCQTLTLPFSVGDPSVQQTGRMLAGLPD